MKECLNFICKESIRSLSKQDAFQIIEELNKTICSMLDSQNTKSEIVLKIDNEISSLMHFFKLDIPYNQELQKDNFVYQNSVIKFDKENLHVFVADVYSSITKDYQGLAIKSDKATVVINKNLLTQKCQIETSYEDA